MRIGSKIIPNGLFQAGSRRCDIRGPPDKKKLGKWEVEKGMLKPHPLPPGVGKAGGLAPLFLMSNARRLTPDAYDLKPVFRDTFSTME